MANLRILFGLIPKTGTLEANEAALIKEYNELEEFSKSKEFDRYQELEALISSNEFIQKKKEIESQKFTDTEEYKKEQQFHQLDKSKDIKNYYKIKSSPQLQKFQKISQSGIIEKANELEKFINSPEFNEAKSSKEYKKSPAHQKEIELKKIKKSSDYKFYYKFQNNPVYQSYQKLEGSPDIETYEELKKFVQSSKFKKVKDYMKLSPKKKYEQSEEYQKEQEYLGLKNSSKFKWYFSLKDSNKFDELKKWKISFEDDFEGTSLDNSKWLTNYFWGDMVLNDKYSMITDKHIPSDNNIQVKNSVATIITRKEKANGKAWSPEYGFVPKEFDYTSGILCNGKNFKQKYGRFKAKVRLNKPSGVTHAFWMLSEHALPHVDVFKFQKNKLVASNFWGSLSDSQSINKFISKITGAKLCENFYIYSLEWSPGKMVWKINDIEVASQTQGLPTEPMFLNFSSGIYDGDPSSLPATMDIDWVRCYELSE